MSLADRLAKAQQKDRIAEVRSRLPALNHRRPIPRAVTIRPKLARVVYPALAVVLLALTAAYSQGQYLS